jgi:hypothetical protein
MLGELRFVERLQTRREGHVVEDGLHGSAVERRPAVEGWDAIACRVADRAEARVARSGVANFGSTVPAFRYFVTVLRDRPVRRAISLTGSFSRNAMRRMMFKSPMWITPMSPVAHRVGGRVTWLKSQ